MSETDKNTSSPNELATFESIPVGSYISRPDDESTKLLDLIGNTPPGLTHMLGDPQTGAYVRGLTRSHDIPAETAPSLAYAVLLVGLGLRTLAELPAILSTELKVANDKAQAIAREIEHDLFSNLTIELTKVRAQSKQAAGRPAEASAKAGARNVLNLKQPTPARPPQTTKNPPTQQRSQPPRPPKTPSMPMRPKPPRPQRQFPLPPRPQSGER